MRRFLKDEKGETNLVPILIIVGIIIVFLSIFGDNIKAFIAGFF